MIGIGKRVSRRRAGNVLRTCSGGALLVAVILPAAGCMIPSYQLPAGFSSSYQRQIYGMEPVPPDPHLLGMAAVETHPGIFYPTTAFHDSPSPTQQAVNPKTMEPMLLQSDTPKTTAKNTALPDLF